MLVVQSCPAFCNPVDCSLPGSSIHGTLQARILEQVAILFSRESSLPRDWTRSSHIAGRFFTAWATRESHSFHISKPLLRSSPLFEILSLSLSGHLFHIHSPRNLFRLFSFQILSLYEHSYQQKKNDFLLICIRFLFYQWMQVFLPFLFFASLICSLAISLFICIQSLCRHWYVS